MGIVHQSQHARRSMDFRYNGRVEFVSCVERALIMSWILVSFRTPNVHLTSCSPSLNTMLVTQVPLPTPVQAPGTEAPNAPLLSRHYMKFSREACVRCHRRENDVGTCPGPGVCPVLGVVPVETTAFLVDKPRLRVSVLALQS